MSQVTLSEVESLTLQLSREEQVRLMERLAREVRTATGASPRSLYGIWRGSFPADLDLDWLLSEIRSKWTEREGL